MLVTIYLVHHSMRSVKATFVFMALASPAAADECKIRWWNLFLPQSEVDFEKTSDVSARLTLKNTSKLEPVTFDLALTTFIDKDGKGVDALSGTQTLVQDELSNQVTVNLRPNNIGWVIVFDTAQSLRRKDGVTIADRSPLMGILVCNELMPWL